MNQMLRDRRSRKRMHAGGKVDILAGDACLSTELIDLSFVGMRCRVDPKALAALPGPIDGVRIEDFPPLPAFAVRKTEDEYAVVFEDPARAGPVIAGFIELYARPES